MSTIAPVNVQPWLAIVGIGMAGWTDVPAGAREAIEAAEWIIGGERHLAVLPDAVMATRRIWPRPFTHGLDEIMARRGRRVVVLASGDPFWYGAGASLARRVPAAEYRCWPAPSSFSLAASRMGWALQHVSCLSVHGRDMARVGAALADGARLLVLSWDGRTPAALAAWLVDQGFGASRVTMLAHLGGGKEQRRSTTATAWPAERAPDLNILAIDCVAGPDAPPSTRLAGLADRHYGGTGQLTKREVRAVVLALLAPGAGETLWDIGAGSGTIGIEWQRSGRGNRAVAIEPRADRIERIRANATRLGVPGLSIIAGRAPDVLAEAGEAPSAIFIGGGLSMPGMLDRCMQVLRAGGRLVATSVTLEGDQILLDAYRRLGGSLRRLDVARAAPLGEFSSWQPHRPVTIWGNRDETVEPGP